MNNKEILKIVDEFPRHFSVKLKQRDLSFYNEVNQLKGESFSQKLYNYIYEEGKCKYCNKETKLISFKEGYRKYCSISCQNKDKIKKPKYIEDLTLNELKLKIENITETIISDLWNLGSQKVADIYLNLKELTNFLPKDTKTSQRFYHILNDITEIPICPICNKRKLKYKKALLGYNKICSSNICISKLRKYPEKYCKFEEIDYNLSREQLKDVIKEASKDFNVYLYHSNFSFKYSKTIHHLTDFFKLKTSYGMRVSAILNDVYEQPRCKRCNKMIHYNGTYNNHEYCSLRCMASSKDVKDKKKKTNLERYGYDSQFKRPEVKQAGINKFTNDVNIINISQIPEIREKIKKTNLKNIGHENTFQCEKSYKNRLKGLRNFYSNLYKNHSFDGYLYLIHNPDNSTIKIGITKNLSQRLYKIKKHYSSNCYYINYYKYKYNKIRKLETKLHKIFNDDNVILNEFLVKKLDGRTEWFNDSIKNKLIKTIEEL